MKLKYALLLAAGTLALGAQASAQDEYQGYYGAIGAGVVIANDEANDIESADSLPAAFDSTLETETNISLYGAIGKYFAKGIRAELELASRSQDIENMSGDGLGFGGFPGGTAGVGELTVTTLMFNAYKDFTLDEGGMINPYIGAGVGAALVRPEFGNFSVVTDGAVPQTVPAMAGGNRIAVEDKDYVPAAQAMAGLVFNFTENMLVDVRYRYLRTGEYDYGGYINSTAAAPTPLAGLSGEYTAHEALAGLRWNFGTPVAAAPPPPPPAPTPLFECADGTLVESQADCPVNLDPIADVVYFDYDKSVLTDAARLLIEARAQEALERGEIEIVTVQGNTDTAGSASYNQALSARRAAVVRDALIAEGVDASAITVEALGESNPARPTADGVKEPLNRRTEFEFNF